MKQDSITIEDLEVGDIFFVSRQWGYCTMKEILGFSFYTGQIVLGLEPCDLTKPERCIVKHFKMNKKVKLFQ